MPNFFRGSLIYAAYSSLKQGKLDSYLDTDHEKALILMRQLYCVEQALLNGSVNPSPLNSERCAHLSGVLADEAQMILLDMI